MEKQLKNNILSSSASLFLIKYIYVYTVKNIHTYKYVYKNQIKSDNKDLS